jgi:hypothetical protein
MAVPGLVLRLLSAWSSALRSVVGGTASSAKPALNHEAHLGPFRLCVDELAGGVLGHGQPVGEHVGGAHRTRLVEGEDDRRLGDRHVRGELGPSRRHRQHGQAGEQQGDGHVAPPARPAGDGRAQTARGSNTRSAAASPAPCRQEVGAEHRGYREAEKQGEGPGEAHLTPPARTTSPRAAPHATRSSAAAAANRAEISVYSVTTVKCRLIVWRWPHRGLVVDLVVGRS